MKYHHRLGLYVCVSVCVCVCVCRSKTSGTERAVVLRAIADAVEKNKPELADKEAVNSGKPLQVCNCFAVVCSVLQCVTACCSVLQRVAVCCSVLQCVAVRCSVLQCVIVCCSVLQCVLVYQIGHGQ